MRSVLGSLNLLALGVYVCVRYCTFNVYFVAKSVLGFILYLDRTFI